MLSCAPSPRHSTNLPTNTGTTATPASWSRALESALSAPKSVTKGTILLMPSMAHFSVTVELKRMVAAKL